MPLRLSDFFFFVVARHMLIVALMFADYLFTILDADFL